jgi:hypothetical protein
MNVRNERKERLISQEQSGRLGSGNDRNVNPDPKFLSMRSAAETLGTKARDA